MCAVSPSVVSQIESGRIRTLSANLAVNMAWMLGVSVDWLVDGEGMPSERDIKRSIDRAIACEVGE